jgi:two-component system, OmpR family, phosphate regulon sensor histidine kinase PhoR
MFWRLFILFAALLLASLGLLGVVLLGRVEQYFRAQVEENLKAQALLVEEVVRRQANGLQERIRVLREETGTRITLLADDGRVLADSDEDAGQMENHANRPEVQEARAGRFGSAVRFSETRRRDMMYVALRLEPPTADAAVVRVSIPLARVEEKVAGLRRILWTSAALTGLASVALTLWLARRFGQPLQELARGAERLAAGDYGHKVYPSGPDEIGALARAFNHMSERLGAQFVQLEEDRQQLRLILSGMVEGVIALTADQRILFANDRAAHLLGFPVRTVVGRRLWEVVRQKALQQVVLKALAGEEAVQEELAWDGQASRNLTVHVARLPGTPARGAVLVLHDTSELRRLERVRQEFVANVSHELKTPLSVIKACVETLLDGAVDDPVHREPFLKQVGDQADRLHALILDLLSLARIESGEEVFDFEAVPLGPVVARCLERHWTRAEAKGQRLEAVAPAEAGAVAAWADEDAVSEILENLVDNAVKYTPDGGRITVRWRREGELVWLEVEDTGIGIPEHDLPRIFERFYRVDKARSRELGGTGLGLSIVKHLVQAMHGSITAGSKVGRGTTFSIRLPRAPAA